MKRIIKITGLALAIAFGASATQAQDLDLRPYVGVSGGGFYLTYEATGVLTQSEWAGGGFVMLGVDINKYLALELRGGLTGDAKKNYPNGSMTLKADHFFSYLVKGKLPLEDGAWTLYGVLGATTAQVTGTAVSIVPASTVTASITKTGFSGGAGFEYNVDDNLSIGAEWVSYWSGVDLSPVEKASASGVSGTVKYSF